MTRVLPLSLCSYDRSFGPWFLIAMVGLNMRQNAMILTLKAALVNLDKKCINCHRIVRELAQTILAQAPRRFACISSSLCTLIFLLLSLTK